jgi:long-subunit fatty acid transport protein
VDTANINGIPQVIARSEAAESVNQENKIITKGGVHEIALSLASNMDDKFFLGLSLGIPIVNYSRTAFWKEEDVNGKGNNEFAYSSFSETYTSNGFGLNAKLGLLFKPIDRLRIGFAFHTPTLYGLRDNIDATMTTDIDTARGSVKVFTVKSAELYGGENPTFRYDLASPWRMSLGAAFVINEVADVTRQRGFISADVEYVGYASPRFSTAEPGVSNDIYKPLNSAVKNSYRGAFNFRAGGELKFNVVMARLGFAYLGNPYRDKALQASRMNLSGGIGYRNKGYIIDLTYVHSLQKNVNFPYRVEQPRLNTFATLRDQASNLVLTFGMKF